MTKQITEQQATEVLAEMRGWEKNRTDYTKELAWMSDHRGIGVCTKFEYLVADFRPLHDANQALECLEAWLSQHDDDPWCEIWTGGKGLKEVTIEEHVNMSCGCCSENEQIAFAQHKDLCYAIATALCSAQMGEAVTIKETEV